MNDKVKFGRFISEMRNKHAMNMQELAQRLEITTSYLSQLERGIRNNPSLKLLKHISEVLQLNEEVNKLFDLCAKANNTVSPDIIEYINQHNVVLKVLRVARDVGVDDMIWIEFIERLKK